MRHLLVRLFAVLAGLSVLLTPATAESFDFYVLSLSWSPTYCQGPNAYPDSPQCDVHDGHPSGFIVHGLWPQYEYGFPSDCRSADWPTRGETDAIVDLMADPGLVRHEWRTHGSCTGLKPAGYFDTIRQARARVVVPQILRQPTRPQKLATAGIEAAFIRANPGLPAAGIAIRCDGDLLQEVRICMTRSLKFRACEEVDRKACRRQTLTIPPVR